MVTMICQYSFRTWFNIHQVISVQINVICKIHRELCNSPIFINIYASGIMKNSTQTMKQMKYIFG